MNTKKTEAAANADVNTMTDKTKTDRAEVQQNIGAILGKEYYGGEQRLGQFLLNVARLDPKLAERKRQIEQNFRTLEEMEDTSFVWLWDITDEEWEQALKRYTNE